MKNNFIIDGAESFFLKGGDTGIILIHGFTGSPAELILLGEFLNRAGFTVLGVRLAGHGTDTDDFIRTNKFDWFNSVLDGYSILKGACKKIIAVGHSMGGLLALKLSAIHDVEKIITLAAPIFIADETDIATLPPREMCKDLFVVRPRRTLENVPPAANLVYRKTPLINVHELLDIIDDVKNILPQINSPILIMHGEEDHTAKIDSANYIEKNIGSTVIKKIFIPGTGHLLPLTDTREIVFAEILKFLEENHVD